MRISTAHAYDATIDALSKRMSDLTATQSQISTNQRVNKASDDPTAAARAERANARLQTNDANQRALGMSQNAMTLSESALGSATELLTTARDAMVAAGVIGVARVVLHTKERLCALIPDGDALVLNTIRWAEEIRPRDEIDFPGDGKTVKPKEAELKMARQLIADMTGPWKPADYQDKFTSAIHALAAQRVKAGKTEKVTSLEGEAEAPPSNVVDLTALLKKSLETRKSSGGHAPQAAAKTTARKSAKKAAKTAAKPASKARRAA